MFDFLKKLLQPTAPESVGNAYPPPQPGSEPDFNLAFDRLIGHEGKFSNVRTDRGNWTSGRVGIGELKGTKFGISAMSYPELDIKNISVDLARSIYYRDFWLRSGSDQFDGAIGYQVFDAAVNHGIENSIRMLQRAANVADDGNIGPLSLKAIKDMSVTDVLMRFNGQRIRFYTKLSTWNDFGKGWMIRVAGNLDYGAEDS